MTQQAEKTKRKKLKKRDLLALCFLLVTSYVAYAKIIEYSYIPKLSDFTPNYICPEEDAPQYCEEPVIISVECALPGHPLFESARRNLTRQENIHIEKACDLLPIWLEQDPRITVSSSKQEEHFIFIFIPNNELFLGFLAHSETKNGYYITGGSPVEPLQKAGDYVEQMISNIDRGGHFP